MVGSMWNAGTEREEEREEGRERRRETCFMYSLQIAIMSLFYRYFMSSGHG